MDSIVLGGQPVVMSGVAPYTFTWSCSYNTPSSSYTASDFLDDTTIANPTILSPSDSTLTFHLLVEDGAGSICRDSVTILFSIWGANLMTKYAGIDPGDSVRLYTSLFGGIPPISYKWTPTTGLSDPNDLNTWAKPDTNTLYTLTATDSVGCQDYDGFFVFIVRAGTSDEGGQGITLKLYPNPMLDQSTLNIEDFSQEHVHLEIYDVSGRLIRTQVLYESNVILQRSDIGTGLFFLKITKDDRVLGSAKLIIR